MVATFGVRFGSDSNDRRSFDAMQCNAMQFGFISLHQYYILMTFNRKGLFLAVNVDN